MPVFLDRIDAAPLQDDDFTFSFNSWVSVTVDTINEALLTIQNFMNGISDGIVIPSFTSAEIVDLATTAPDGTMWYSTDHVPPVYVGKINGALVQFTTAAFP